MPWSSYQSFSYQALEWIVKKQCTSEGFDCCDRPSNLSQIWFKSSIFLRVWPSNLMDDLAKQWGTCSKPHQVLCIIWKPSVNSNCTYGSETLNSGQNRRFFVPCELEIWRMTSKNNNRTPLLCHCKFRASFRNHVPIQTGVTVRKRPNWDKICFDLFDLWPLTLTFCMDITFVNGNKSWKFHDDTMAGTLWKGVIDGRTEGQADGRTDWRTEVFLTYCRVYPRKILKQTHLEHFGAF